MTRQRTYRLSRGYPHRPHTLDSEAAFARISQSPLFYDPPRVWSYAKVAKESMTPEWRLKNLIERANCVGRTPYDEVENILLEEGFQYIYAYDGNPKMAVRPHMCELVEGDQLTARFTFVTCGYDMVAFDSDRDALLFRMGDVHEEFLSNVPA